MKNQSWTILSIATLIFAAQIIIFQFIVISRLRDEVRIAEKAKNIETDQSQDLMYQLTQMKAELEAIGTRQFVAGVVTSVTKPDFYTEIWHDGYDRGVNVTQYAESLNVGANSQRKIQTSIKNQ